MTQQVGGSYLNGIPVFVEQVSTERALAVAPVTLYDDFIQPSLVIPDSASLESGVSWAKKIIGAAPPTVACDANGIQGTVSCTLTSASQKQDAEIYSGDTKNWCLDNGPVMEWRAKIAVLPTGTATMFMGFASNWSDGPDTITYSVWFALRGSGAVVAENDDNVTDNGAKSTGVTVLATEWHIYRIDASNKADIRFYIDGAPVALATTFNHAASAGANSTMQPFFGCYKPSGTDVGTMTLDYVRIWQASRT